MPALPADPIFISYSRRDDETMRKIAFFLRDRGFKVWVDNEKLIPGSTAWEESIEKAIKNALAVIVVLSPDSKNSEWVRREITYADQFQKRVFPVLVKGSDELSLPIRLITRQYVDFRTNEEAGLEALLSAIIFHIEEKQTLEMKRPLLPKKVRTDSPLTPSFTSQSKKGKAPIHWTIPAGILITLCILGVGTIWTGYRLYSLSIPITGVETVESTVATITPATTITNAFTDTPTKTSTPTHPDISAPDILSQYLIDPQITNLDTFDIMKDGWDVQAGKIQNGVMEIYGNTDWNGAWRDHVFTVWEGALIDFSFSKGSTFTIHMNNGVGGSSYRRFGIYFENGFPLVDLYMGDYILEEFSKNSGFQKDMVYTMLIARLSEEEFMEVFWDASTQSVVAEFRKKFDDMPTGSTWTFLIQVPEGTVQFDNFMEIEFNGAK